MNLYMAGVWKDAIDKTDDDDLKTLMEDKLSYNSCIN